MGEEKRERERFFVRDVFLGVGFYCIYFLGGVWFLKNYNVFNKEKNINGFRLLGSDRVFG